MRAGLVIAVAVALTAGLAGQTPVPLAKEPHHKQILYTAHLRVFEIAVPPAASTLDHSHDRDIVTVALGAPTLRTRVQGGEWSAPRSYAPGAVNVAEYTGKPAVHRMEVLGTVPYRVFAVENLRERGWTTPGLIEATATRLLQQTRAFAAYDVRLEPPAPSTSHVHQMPTVVILVSGSVVVQGGGGESQFVLDGPGRWFWSSWDQPHTLTAQNGAAHVVEVEVR